MNHDEYARDGKSLRRSRIAFWVIAAIAGYFLLVEHGEHVFSFLPYALILACPLMHVFHRGHGRHRLDDQAPSDCASSRAPSPSSAPDEHRH